MVSGISSNSSYYYYLSQQRQTSSESSSLANRVFGGLDTNGDGSISKDEFQQLMSGLSGGGLTGSITGSPMDSASLMDLVRDAQKLDSATGATTSTDQLYSSIDADGDGAVSEDELDQFASSLGSQSGAASGPGSIEDLFSKIDTDGDGSVTKDEFSQFASKAGSMPPPPPPPPDSASSLGSLLESLGTSSTDQTAAGTTSATDETSSVNDFMALMMEAISRYMQYGQSSQDATSTLSVTG